MGFAVTRMSHSFVTPAAPTPGGTLELSVIDRVPGLRHLVRSLHVFERGSEPARMVREALGMALVDYYPFAGRFVEDGGGEVCVACTGEGAWFVEAVAGCSLEDVKFLDHPLVISEDELLPEPTADMRPLDMPVMMQVTEFTCGGFVVGLVSVHTIADGLGAGQFVNAVADYARGLPKPRVSPIWARELIPSPPKPPLGPPPAIQTFALRHLTVDLSFDHINKVKAQYLASTGQRCSAFDVSVAKTWQARCRAMRLDAGDPVSVCFFANTRHLLHQAWPKDGAFYGNCFYPVTVASTSGAVEGADLVGVVRIIRDAKARLAADFARWAVGECAEDPYELTFTYESLFVSDWTRLGFLEADYGWGPPVHVIPFSYHPFMAVAIIGAPPAPKAAARVMTQCVEEVHLPAFEEEMKTFCAINA